MLPLYLSRFLLFLLSFFFLKLLKNVSVFYLLFFRAHSLEEYLRKRPRLPGRKRDNPKTSRTTKIFPEFFANVAQWHSVVKKREEKKENRFCPVWLITVARQRAWAGGPGASRSAGSRTAPWPPRARSRGAPPNPPPAAGPHVFANENRRYICLSLEFLQNSSRFVRMHVHFEKYLSQRENILNHFTSINEMYAFPYLES